MNIFLHFFEGFLLVNLESTMDQGKKELFYFAFNSSFFPILQQMSRCA